MSIEKKEKSNQMQSEKNKMSHAQLQERNEGLQKTNTGLRSHIHHCFTGISKLVDTATRIKKVLSTHAVQKRPRELSSCPQTVCATRVRTAFDAFFAPPSIKDRRVPMNK